MVNKMPLTLALCIVFLRIVIMRTLNTTSSGGTLRVDSTGDVKIGI